MKLNETNVKKNKVVVDTLEIEEFESIGEFVAWIQGDSPNALIAAKRYKLDAANPADSALAVALSLLNRMFSTDICNKRRAEETGVAPEVREAKKTLAAFGKGKASQADLLAAIAALTAVTAAQSVEPAADEGVDAETEEGTEGEEDEGEEKASA